MESKPSYLKIALIIWAPIIVLGAAYGGAYWITYSHAKSKQTAYQNNTAGCEAHEGDLCYLPNGSGIVHGNLGLFKFISPGWDNTN